MSPAIELEGDGGAAAVAEALARLAIGPERAFHNLTAFPLLAEAAAEPDYVTLDEALALGTVHITEVSEGGSVPDLKLVNEGAQRVLLLDGEELVGAKQNRVLNLTVLVAPRSTLIVPVSCVEAGRWAARSREFSSSPGTLFARSRAKKVTQVSQSLRATGTRRSNQGEVWEDIAEKQRALAAPSPTSAMADTFVRHAATLDEYVNAFAPVENQVGVLFAVSGVVAGMDLFDHPVTLGKLLPKLVRSYALDALDTPPNGPATPEKAKAFLAAVGAARVECFPAIGEGTDVRLTGARVAGAALVAGGRAVHLGAFPTEGEAGSLPGTLSRMSRASSRRRHIQETGGTPPVQ